METLNKLAFISYKMMNIQLSLCNKIFHILISILIIHASCTENSIIGLSCIILLMLLYNDMVLVIGKQRLQVLNFEPFVMSFIYIMQLCQQMLGPEGRASHDGIFVRVLYLFLYLCDT
jgi:hypothetical protein